MKVTLEWIEEFCTAKLKAGKLADQLTLAGLEVEAVAESVLGEVLDISITANRGDCLSVMGLAHEIGAITGIPPKKMPTEKTPRSALGEAPVVIKASKLCTRYCGQLMEGVTLGPSPKWMSQRLEACGIRSINNVVDITNYVMLEMGQPLHAFDLDRLEGGGVQVRLARPGEVLVTLDGKERVLIREDLVIADKQGPVALAGVMGGLNSEIHDGTKRLFLESAFFAPRTVRRTGKRLGLKSESSYRFERGVDWFRVRLAIDRMSDLLEAFAGATRVGSASDIFSEKPKTVRIPFDPQKVSSLLGGDWKVGGIERPLKRLGCLIKKSSPKKWWVTIPSPRHDLRQPVDLVEEVARLTGYDSIESENPQKRMQVIPKSRANVLESQIKNRFVSLGFSECIHFSFCNEEGLKMLGEPWLAMAPRLENPLSQETTYLRPSLLLSMLGAVRYHQSRQMMTLRLFELRTVFHMHHSHIEEKKVLTGLLTGESLPQHWKRQRAKSDFYEAKGVVECVLQMFGLENFKWEALDTNSPYSGFFHPSRVAQITYSGRSIGIVGELHPQKESDFELRGPILAFEIEWDKLLNIQFKRPRYREVSSVPWVERDLALLVDESVSAGEVENIIKGSDEEMVRNILIFDLYRGNQIPRGKKGLAFTYQIGHPDRTLTDEEVEALQRKIVLSLKNRLQVEVR